MWSDLRPGCFTPWDWAFDVPTASHDVLEKRKIPCPCRNSNPLSSSLLSSHYTKLATHLRRLVSKFICSFWGLRDRVISIVIRLWDGRSGIRILGRARNIFLPHGAPLFWYLPSLSINEYRDFFPEEKRPGREYTSTPSIRLHGAGRDFLFISRVPHNIKNKFVMLRRQLHSHLLRI